MGMRYRRGRQRREYSEKMQALARRRWYLEGLKPKLPETMQEAEKRYKEDRRGELFDEQTRLVAPGRKLHVRMVYSVYGRLDQLDVYVDGVQLKSPMSKRTIAESIMFAGPKQLAQFLDKEGWNLPQLADRLLFG